MSSIVSNYHSICGCLSHQYLTHVRAVRISREVDLTNVRAVRISREVDLTNVRAMRISREVDDNCDT